MAGLLIGFIIGSFAMGLLFYLTLTLRVDWDKYASDIRNKMKHENQELKDEC